MHFPILCGFESLFFSKVTSVVMECSLLCYIEPLLEGFQQFFAIQCINYHQDLFHTLLVLLPFHLLVIKWLLAEAREVMWEHLILALNHSLHKRRASVRRRRRLEATQHHNPTIVIFITARLHLHHRPITLLVHLLITLRSQERVLIKKEIAPAEAWRRLLIVRHWFRDSWGFFNQVHCLELGVEVKISDNSAVFWREMMTEVLKVMVVRLLIFWSQNDGVF